MNLIDTWRLRPEAVTKIPNLFLASDYVRTDTDLATMEAANEAARRAVNGILEASGSDALTVRRCGICTSRRSSSPGASSTRIRYARRAAVGRHPGESSACQWSRLVDKAILALEGGSETHDVFGSHGLGLSAGPQQIFSLIDRSAAPGVMSDLRRDATSLLERLVRIVALRLVEAPAPDRRPSPRCRRPQRVHGRWLTLAGRPPAVHVREECRSFRGSPGRSRCRRHQVVSSAARRGTDSLQNAPFQLSGDDACRAVVGGARPRASAVSVRSAVLPLVANRQEHQAGALHRHLSGLRRRRRGRDHVRHRHRDAAQRVSGARRRGG